MWIKSNWSAPSFQYISIAHDLNVQKTNCINVRLLTVDIEINAIMSLGLVSSPHLLYDFSSKMFLCLYSIKWPNFTVWLPLLLEILGNAEIFCFPCCDLINFKTNLSFLIKPFSYKTKKVNKNLNIFRTKRAF